MVVIMAVADCVGIRDDGDGLRSATRWRRRKKKLSHSQLGRHPESDSRVEEDSSESESLDQSPRKI